jgi:outer membrane protein OmpA-like peptidoglycan-associated protein
VKKRQAERKAAEEAAQPEGKGEADGAAERVKKRQAERKAAEEAAQQEGQAESAAERRKKRQAEEQATQEEAQKPAEDGESAERRPRRSESGKAEAPVLDSQKQQAAPAAEDDGSETNRASRRERERRRQQAEEAAPAGPPPESDRAAQEAAQPREIKPVTEERGKRRERAPDDEPRRRERPEGVDIVKEFKDRVIVELGNQYFVESDDRPRLTRNAREVYYEDLPRGRTREVVVRPNGAQVITVRNRYGDVIRRSRLTPEGREIVMVYVEEDDYDRVREWRDPGLDLPPMRLEIPVEEYILDAEQVRAPDDYYTFLEQPPVERVERLYSIDEVKRSARIRDKTRRIDLDTLTFEFGSADIPEDQVAKLEGVAEAIQRLLEKNPAETFLIEGHTDAVGSDMANLALSDRRAESVADALTNVFDIPPENLATQGYGEQYLKVNTEAPERENRRVAIRRVTPLVAPVASAE